MRPEPPEGEQFDPVEYAAELERARDNAAARGDGAGDNGFQGEAQTERREDPTAEDWTPQELYCVYEPAFPQLVPRLIPHLGHVILFFVLALVALAVGQVLGVLGLEHLHLMGHKSFNALAQLADDDARLSIPIQALSYGLIAVVVIPVFTLLWNEPFGKGVHWSGGDGEAAISVTGAAGAGHRIRHQPFRGVSADAEGSADYAGNAEVAAGGVDAADFRRDGGSDDRRAGVPGISAAGADQLLPLAGTEGHDIGA